MHQPVYEQNQAFFRYTLQFNLFSLFDTGKSTDYRVTKVTSDTSEQTVSISFGPPQPSGTVPLEQQTAFVLGDVAEYPAKLS
jgi:hypothetical protein